MAKVSVIVPVHNGADHLAECLASIERQSLRDIEVICIDDASTDASTAIYDLFARDDERFRLISFDVNRGVSAARNEGIRRATGDFLAFMDGDDWYPEDTTLEKLHRAASGHGASIAGGSFSEYDNRTDRVRTDYSDEDHLCCFTFHEEGMVDYRDWQGDYGFQRFIFKRSFVIENGLEFPPLKRHEDPVFLVRAMVAAGRFYAIPDVVYRYRFHHKARMMLSDAIDDAIEAIAEILAVSFQEDLPVLRRWQKELLQWYAIESLGLVFHEKDFLVARAKVLNGVARSRVVRQAGDIVGSYRAFASEVLDRYRADAG